MAAGLTKRIRSNWRSAILVCRKCSKKVGGGFGADGDTALAKALRKHLHLKKGRKAAAGIVEVGCLGVCPKGAVTLVNGHASRDWFLVRPGTDLNQIVNEIGL